MSAPPRKPVVVAEATQELQADAVVGVLDTIGTVHTAGSVSGVSLPRPSLGSQASVAPVGLDLAQGRDNGDDEEIMQTTSSVVLPARRRNLSKIVFGTLGACAIILLAAGIARIGHAMSEPAAASSGTVASLPGANAPSTAAATTPSTPALPGKAATPASIGATASDPASAGTVRLGKPTLAGHVWLDGKKLSATSVLVSCGTHQVKVGHGRKHSIDVPCGGEISVSR
jgi:hypothetical protein